MRGCGPAESFPYQPTPPAAGSFPPPGGSSPVDLCPQGPVSWGGGRASPAQGATQLRDRGAGSDPQCLVSLQEEERGTRCAQRRTVWGHGRRWLPRSGASAESSLPTRGCRPPASPPGPGENRGLLFKLPGRGLSWRPELTTAVLAETTWLLQRASECPHFSCPPNPGLLTQGNKLLERTDALPFLRVSQHVSHDPRRGDNLHAHPRMQWERSCSMLPEGQPFVTAWVGLGHARLSERQASTA